MADHRLIVRTACTLAIAALVAACSGAAVPSAAPPASVVASAEAAVPETQEPTVSAPATATPATPPPSRRPRPSLDVDLAELDAYLTSTITLVDLADEDLEVVVTYVDPGSETPFPLGVYTLESMDQITNDAPPGTYTLEFHQPAGSTSATSCTFEIADAEGYIFAALGDAVAITTTGAQPTDADELFVATSSLCID